MDVDESQQLSNEEDLLYADDGETTEYTTGEVEQLLGEDDEDHQSYDETTELAVQEGDTEEAEQAEPEHTEEVTSARGRGSGRRAMMRGMRGRFMMRGMMMGPPGFFPPVPLRPGMRPPPFPPFMAGPGRPPFLMRGMRMPMPPPRMLRAMMNRETQNQRKKTSETKEKATSSPRPLMSIDTPAPVKALVHMQQRSQNMARGYNSRGSTSSVRGSTSSVRGTGMTRPALKRPVQPVHVDHGEPRPKVASIAPRSNLRTIQTEPMQTASQKVYQRPPGQAHPMTQHQSYSAPPQMQNNGYQAKRSFVVSHKPAPNLTQIPLAPAQATAHHQVTSSRPVKVIIWNLPPSANFAEVSSMTTSCGSVQTLNVRKENNSAVIEFSNSLSADNFIRLYNNTVMGGSVLTVNKVH